ncbi:hypothetical protein HPP92_026284 [Vanilla planifolia]|uniref:Transferrin receptor-like dimerisation domain-containing protein n=1 Tax=Vanilla planifolia TaxID=51239 RepID=A0A835U6F0_VANPL|nr:hypothetical protein HPP92_026284 [Vanilla planifolia]
MLKEVSKEVQDPDNSSQSLFQSWVASDHPLIGRLGGAGTDFAAFVQHVGIPQLICHLEKADTPRHVPRVTFEEERKGKLEGYPVYHSMYDDFLWMQLYGDPLFHRHVAAANIWGLVALKLADEEFLPFDYLSYASELQENVGVFEREAVGFSISFAPLYNAIEELKKASAKVSNQRKDLEKMGWMAKWKKDPSKVRELNDRLLMTERALTSREGLSGRPWYKHLIYGPSQYNDYESKSFPGIDDAVENAKKLNTSESRRLLQHEVWRVARAISQASLVLSGELK